MSFAEDGQVRLVDGEELEVNQLLFRWSRETLNVGGDEREIREAIGQGARLRNGLLFCLGWRLVNGARVEARHHWRRLDEIIKVRMVSQVLAA